MVTLSTLRDWEDDLRAACPPHKRTRVVVKYLPPHDPELEGHRGTCERDKQVFTICISSGMSPSETLDVLAHEWAHMRAWVWRGIDDDHGPHWAIEYGRAHNALHHIR